MGPGANGKSKFFGVLQAVLASYATIPDKSLLNPLASPFCFRLREQRRRRTRPS